MRIAINLICCFCLSSCINFNMTDEEFHSAFETEKVMPVSATVDVDGNTVHYVFTAQKKNKLLIFVHGSPGSWSAFIDFFKNDSLLQNFDIVSVDRPGFGRSDYGRPEKSMEKQAYLIKAVIDEFPHPNKILIGHSLGGPVIARIAMDYPELVDGLVMIAPSIDPEMEKDEWYRTWIKTKFVGALTPTDFWVSNEEILPLKEELKVMLPLWERIEIPTVVIHGTNDMLVPKENAEFAQKMLIDSLVSINYLKGVNHFIPWSDPQEIVSAILFLAH